jgi:hypothetical protein
MFEAPLYLVCLMFEAPLYLVCLTFEAPNTWSV